MEQINNTLTIDISVEDQNEIDMSLQESEQVGISAEKVIKAGSGVSDYEKLHNLPTIDGIKIKGEVKGEIEKLFPEIPQVPEWALQIDPPVYTAADIGAVSDEIFNIELKSVKDRIAANLADINSLDKELQSKADISLIPVVNNGKLTFQVNGEDVESFFANQQLDVVVNFSIPVKLTDLYNDSNFALIESPVFTGVPKAPTAPANTNDLQIATTAFVKQAINALVDGAPETLDTLKEVADAIEINKDTVIALNAVIGSKVDKVEGKGLSTNDLTNELLAEIKTHEQNVQANWNETNVSSDAFIKNKPNSLPASDVYEWAKQSTKPEYTASEVGALSVDASTAIEENSDNISKAQQAILEVKQNIAALSESVQNLSKLISDNASDIDTLDSQIQELAPIKSPVFTGTPKAPTALATTNNTQIATTGFVKTVVNNLINGAPETLDTLGEIAAAIKDNETVIEALNAAVGKKVDKEEGKALSSNDFSDEYVQKVNQNLEDISSLQTSVDELNSKLSALNITRVEVEGYKSVSYKYNTDYNATILILGRASRQCGALYLITHDDVVLPISTVGDSITITVQNGILTITNPISSMLLGMLFN